MKHFSILFLKLVILLIAVRLLAGMIIFPQTEGRAANLDLISIYKDPFIVYIYLASIPFFVGLYQAFRLLGLIDKNKLISPAAFAAVRKIKYCVISLPVLIILADIFIVLNANGDDFAGPVALSAYTTFACIVIATALAIFERYLRNSSANRSKSYS